MRPALWWLWLVRCSCSCQDDKDRDEGSTLSVELTAKAVQLLVQLLGESWRGRMWQ